MVAGVSAAVLIIVMFLPWYGVSVKASFGGFSASASRSASAWEAYGGRDILLFLIALVVLGYVVLRALDALPASLPFDAPLVILGLGVIAAILVLIGILHIPTGGVGEVSTRGFNLDFSRKIGIYLGFLATLGIAYGGWAVYTESRRGITPAAAGPGGGLSGPGSVPPSSSTTTPPSAAAPTEPLGTTGTPPASPTPSATPPASEFGSAPGPAPGAAPASMGGGATPPGPAPTPPASQPAQPPQPAGAGPQNPPADWYPDPHGQARLRWWDGSQWTDQTAD